MADTAGGLTEAEYNGSLRALGLRPTSCNTEKTTVYSTVEGEAISVPNANWQSAEQRKETINRIKIQLGIHIPKPSYLN